MRIIGPKLSNKLSTPNAKKVIKTAEITLIESAKVAATMIGQSLTKNPEVFNYKDVKSASDFLEFWIRTAVGVSKTKLHDYHHREKLEKVAFGNPANVFSDCIYGLVHLDVAAEHFHSAVRFKNNKIAKIKGSNFL